MPPATLAPVLHSASISPEALRAQFTLSPLLAPPPTVDRRRSRRLARLVRARNGNCFANAVRGLLYDHTLGADVCYVEGVVVVDYTAPMITEHGWLEDASGVILDPTPAYHATAATPRCYFAIARYPRDQVFRRIAEARDPSECCMPWLSYRPGWGQDLPGWGPAQVAALRHRSALHVARHGTPLIAPAEEADALGDLLGTWSHYAALRAVSGIPDGSTPDAGAVVVGDRA